MNDFKKFRKYLEEIKNVKNALDVLKHDRIMEVTNACEHPVEFCREFYFGSDFLSEFPYIICTQCGYSEEGWGCGYLKLRHADDKVGKISAEEFYKLRTRCLFQQRVNDDKRQDRTF